MKIQLLVFAMIFVFASCSKNQVPSEAIQGQWQLTETSGGFTGAGFTSQWNILQIDADEFKVFNDFNDDVQLVATGTVIIKTDSEEEEDLYDFKVVENFADEDLQLQFDPEKTVVVDGSKMEWISPCCDRYNYHFDRL